MMITLVKDIVDYIYDNVPVVDDDTVHKFKYRTLLGGKKLRGEYVVCVKPHRIDSDAVSRNASYPIFAVSTVCVYYLDDSESIDVGYEKLLDWMNDIFNRFHLENFGGLVDHVECDVSFDASVADNEMGQHAVMGAIGFSIKRYVFKNQE